MLLGYSLLFGFESTIMISLWEDLMSLIARLSLLSFLAILTNVISPPTLAAFDEPMLSIKTGNVTGVYYAAGSAVAKMHNRKLKEYNLRLIAESSEGSIANVNDVTSGSAAFGIAQANALYFAKKGEDPWQGAPQTTLRSVLGLYTEDLTLVAAVDADIHSLADLKGKVVNISEPGSVDRDQAMEIFNLLGLDPENDLTVDERPTYEAAELLQNGDIDAYFYTVGHPNLSIIEASHGERKVKIVTLEPEIVDSLDRQKEYLVTTDIPIDYYSEIANKEPVRTLSVKAILFTSAGTDEEVVYHTVKEVFENFELFKKQHPAFATLTKKRMTTKLIVPLHPGAKRYFKEIGLLH
jgi:TRAP transporter TAXI family solute receptor